MSKHEVAKTGVEHYLSLHYTTILRTEEDVVVARIKEFPGCIAHGSNAAEACEHLREVQSLWIEERLDAGLKIPEPAAEEELPSGKWLQRAPRTLHKQLASLAEREGVSFNTIVTTLLCESVALRSHKSFGGPLLARFDPPEMAGWEPDTRAINPSISWSVTQTSARGESLLTRLTTTKRLITDASRNPEDAAYHSHEKNRFARRG
ncbi:MAG: hypothetical protein ABI811_00140 [Acidobacteriota bacterium]